MRHGGKGLVCLLDIHGEVAVGDGGGAARLQREGGREGGRAMEEGRGRSIWWGRGEQTDGREDGQTERDSRDGERDRHEIETQAETTEKDRGRETERETDEK